MQAKALLLVLAVALGATSVKAQCPNGFINFAGDSSPAPICLMFAQQMKANWYAWRMYCQSIGADLAKVTGELHQNLVTYIMDHPDMRDEAYYVGGTDMLSEGDWVWISDNTPIVQGPPHWYPCTQQPDYGTLENFLCLYTPDFYFHSCTNDEEYYAICQI